MSQIRGISFVMFSLLSSVAYGKELQIQRPDGSQLTYYVEEPQKRESFPIVVVLQDAECISVQAYHDQIAAKAAGYLGAAVVTVEKRGLQPGAKTCSPEYKDKNTVQARIEDYRLVLSSLKANMSNWDNRIAFAGFGEGGTIAPVLAAENPGTVALALMAAGGGMTRTEELHLLQKKNGSICDIFAPTKLDMVLKEIQKDPSADKSWCDANSSYKWWAGSLAHRPFEALSKVQVPLYIAHGTADNVRPVESADAMVSQLKTLGRADINYARYSGYDHEFKDAGGTSHLFSATLKGMGWMRDILNKGKFMESLNEEEFNSFN